MTLCSSYTALILLVLYTVFSTIIVNKILKHPHPILGSISSSLSGPIALIFVNLTAKFTGVCLCLNVLNIGMSLIAGVPGVCMIIILNMIFAT